MDRMIFVNLPVKDLQKSTDFFKGLGFSFNPAFSDETAACMIISENHSYAMLLTHAKIKEFIKKDIADTTKTTEVLIALSMENKAQVDSTVDAAVKAGGKDVMKQDLGFMYYRSFEDLDGHIWEMTWMDMSAMPPQ